MNRWHEPAPGVEHYAEHAELWVRWKAGNATEGERARLDEVRELIGCDWRQVARACGKKKRVRA